MLDQQLLDTIYASVFDDNALHAALKRLAAVCNSRSAGTFCLSERGLDWSLDHGMPDGFMALFGEHASQDPRIAFSMAHAPLTLMDDSAPELRQGMHASGVETLARDWDLPWTLATRCTDQTDATWGLYVSRSARQGPADPHARDGFRLYAPHFRRALQLRSEARRQQRALRIGARSEPVGEARMLITGSARVLGMSATARDLVRSCDDISLERGQLVLSPPSANARLRQLAGCLADSRCDAPLKGCVDVPQHKTAGILSLCVEAPGTASTRAARTLRVWLRLHQSPSLPAITGKRPSARQRQVLEALDHGCTTARIAHQLGIGEATVRTHVKRLLALTDSHNRRACLAVARQRGWI